MVSETDDSGMLPQAGCAECDHEALVDHAEWNQRMRGENDLQRIDRNFLELLQELRVAQTGVQILFAFMLGLAFTPRFAQLPSWQHLIYLLTLISAASSAALLIAPVSYHRTVFRRRLKGKLVEIGHRCALAGLVLLLLTLVGGVELAASFVLDGWSAVLAAVLTVSIAGLWFLVPLRHRHRHRNYAGPVAVPPPPD
jgi:O-antigen/teichoic acid export membrane protein